MGKACPRAHMAACRTMFGLRVPFLAQPPAVELSYTSCHSPAPSGRYDNSMAGGELLAPGARRATCSAWPAPRWTRGPRATRRPCSWPYIYIYTYMRDIFIYMYIIDIAQFIKFLGRAGGPPAGRRVPPHRGRRPHGRTIYIYIYMVRPCGRRPR